MIEVWENVRHFFFKMATLMTFDLWPSYTKISGNIPVRIKYIYPRFELDSSVAPQILAIESCSFWWNGGHFLLMCCPGDLWPLTLLHKNLRKVISVGEEYDCDIWVIFLYWLSNNKDLNDPIWKNFGDFLQNGHQNDLWPLTLLHKNLWKVMSCYKTYLCKILMRFLHSLGSY